MHQGNIAKILGGPFTGGAKEVKPVDEQIRLAMSQIIQNPPNVIIDGRIHRFATGPHGTDDAGWYVFFDGEISAGSFGDWRTGETLNFCQDLGRELTPLEIQQKNRRIAEAKQVIAENEKLKHEHAAGRAKELWEKAIPADPEHPYLKRKGIKVNGARALGEGSLIVPLHDPETKEIASLQYITDTDKRYIKGGKTKGCYWSLGGFDNPKKIFIAEGFATAATIYEETLEETIVAYSMNNLPLVAQSIRKLHPSSEIIIVADNDLSGVGENKAHEAAAKSGASVVIPPEGDMNDYRISGGNVRELLLEAEGKLDLDIINGKDLSLEYEAPDEIIQDLLVSKSLAIMYGDSNAGKTFFGLSMGYAIAEGEKFHGKMVEKANVLYLATESPGSIRARMQALKKYYKKDLENLYMVPNPLNFHESEGDISKVLKACEKIGNVKFIIADTLARMASGANENSGEDMGPVMNRFSLLAEESGACVMIVHHSGKDKTRGSRGWSGLKAHIETEIEVQEGKATITKQRELPSKNSEFHFALDVIEMGKGKFGNTVSTCVAIQAEAKEKIEENENVNIIRKAWFATGQDMSEGSPYITSSSLANYLFEEGYASSLNNAKQWTKPSAKGYMCFKLLAEKVVEKHAQGYIVVDENIKSAMILSKV